VHAGEHRIIRRAEAETQQRGVRLGTARAPDRRDVARVVHELELRVGGGHRPLDRDPRLVEQAESAGKFDRQLDPDRRQRMAGPEVIGGERFVPGNMQRAGHELILPVAPLPGDSRPGPGRSGPARPRA